MTVQMKTFYGTIRWVLSKIGTCNNLLRKVLSSVFLLKKWNVEMITKFVFNEVIFD